MRDAGRRYAADALILAVATAARVPTLGLRHIVEGDGVHYASLARDVLAGDWSGLGNPYWSNLWPGVIAATSAIAGIDVVAAGRWASLVAGILLPLATARLAAQFLGPTAGLAAGLAAAGHPWLIHFSTLVFTESFFSLLVVLLLLLGLRAITDLRPASVIRAGVVAGLAVVTRPEAFAPLALIAGALAVRWLRGQSPIVMLRRTALLLLPALLLLAVRAGLCRYYYDVWDLGLGSKGTANLLQGLGDDAGSLERVSSEVTADGENKLSIASREESLLGFARRQPLALARHVQRNLARLAAALWHVAPPVPHELGASAFPGPRWARALKAAAAASVGLMGLGLATGFANPASRGGTLLLAAAVLLHVIGLSPLYVSDRLVLVLVPLLLVFFANGLCVAVGARSGRPGLRVVPILLGLAAVSGFSVLQAPSLAWGDDPVAPIAAAEWIAGRYGHDVMVMTPSPPVAFYLFDAPHKFDEVDMPWLAYPELLAYAHDHEVVVLAAPEWYLEANRHPAARELLTPLTPPPGLRHMATVGSPPPYRIHLYAVEAR